MTTLLTPKDLEEISALLDEGGLLDDAAFTSVAIEGLPELQPKRSLVQNSRIRARADLKMVAEHGDAVLLFKWLAAARMRLRGNESLVARLSLVIERTVGEREPDGKPSTWSPSALAKLVDQLAGRYPREPDQRRVVREAQLDEKAIAFDAVAKNSWSAIIEHARKHGLVDRVLDVALDEFEEDEELLAHRLPKPVIDAATEKPKDEPVAQPRVDTASVVVAPAAPAATTRRRIP